MPKSIYQNFKEYSENDSGYLLKALKDELHRPQSKIEFKDGSTYHVTKAGSRYWEKNGYLHHEHGVAMKWSHSDSGIYCLYSVQFKDRSEWEAAMINLNRIRQLTNDGLEEIVQIIAKNIGYERRKEIWETILACDSNSDELIKRIMYISDEFHRLSNITDDFIKEFKR